MTRVQPTDRDLRGLERDGTNGVARHAAGDVANGLLTRLLRVSRP